MQSASGSWLVSRSRNWLAAGAWIALAAFAAADTFVLTDGRRIEGKLARETPAAYFVQTGLGELELKKSDVTERIVGKTARETFDAQFAAAKSADELFQLGTWALEQKLKANAQKAWKRALELDLMHEGANLALGNVLYKGEWMTPELRDQRAAADEAEEMLAKGLVRYQDRWVTPDEKSKLEQGLVLHEGRWMTFGEAQRAKGFDDVDGTWYVRAEALARRDVKEVELVLKRKIESCFSKQAAVAGDYDIGTLEAINVNLDTARTWFDKAFLAPPGVDWLGGRLVQFYVWNRDSKPYVDTVEYFASRTKTVGEGWAEAVAKTHGFYWIDPYAVSSARVWHRPDGDLLGHCAHHWGHMLLGRLGYGGRLLPPWYDESLAALAEFRVFGRNAVFCRVNETIEARGTESKRVIAFALDQGTFRDGTWMATMKKALEAKAVAPLAQLVPKQFPELELLDIATGMALACWLEATAPEGLSKFHAQIRKGQPAAPQRVEQDQRTRTASYDAAFKAAVNMGMAQADQAWRAWVLAQK